MDEVIGTTTIRVIENGMAIGMITGKVIGNGEERGIITGKIMGLGIGDPIITILSLFTFRHQSTMDPCSRPASVYFFLLIFIIDDRDKNVK